MKSTIKTLSCLLVLTAAACQNAPTTLPPGQYEKTEKSTDRHGTKTQKTTKTEVFYDQYGNKHAVQETDSSRDPRGLFNKTTSTTTRTYN